MKSATQIVSEGVDKFSQLAKQTERRHEALYDAVDYYKRQGKTPKEIERNLVLILTDYLNRVAEATPENRSKAMNEVRKAKLAEMLATDPDAIPFQLRIDTVCQSCNTPMQKTHPRGHWRVVAFYAHGKTACSVECAHRLSEERLLQSNGR